MTAYENLYDLFLEAQSHRLVIDRLLRELPSKMRQAVSSCLEVLPGIASMPTLIFGRPTSYVDLYRPRVDESGHQHWERCEIDDSLWRDQTGMYHFSLGIYMDKARDALTSSYAMMYFSFCVESFDERSIKLRIKNLDCPIPIDNAHDQSNYANAGKLAIHLISDSLKRGTQLDGAHASVGFVNLSIHANSSTVAEVSLCDQ